MQRDKFISIEKTVESTVLIDERYIEIDIPDGISINVSLKKDSVIYVPTFIFLFDDENKKIISANFIYNKEQNTLQCLFINNRNMTTIIDQIIRYKKMYVYIFNAFTFFESNEVNDVLEWIKYDREFNITNINISNVISCNVNYL